MQDIVETVLDYGAVRPLLITILFAVIACLGIVLALALEAVFRE